MTAADNAIAVEGAHERAQGAARAEREEDEDGKGRTQRS